MSPVSQPSENQHFTLEPSTLPTPSGTEASFSFCPDHVLNSIAKLNNVSTGSLAKLVVKSNNKTTYHAILEYAALLEANSKNNFKTLAVDGWEESFDESDDDVDRLRYRQEKHYYQSLLNSSSHRTPKLPGGLGLRRLRIPTPKIKFAMGVTSLVWPPPKHLTAEALIALREEKKKAKKTNTTKQSDLEQVENAEDIKPSQSGNEDIAASTNGANESKLEEVSGKENENNETQNTIYLTHYSVGAPVNDGDGRAAVYREITLVSADGHDALREFATGIIKWVMEKNYHESDGSHFALHRFVMEGRSGGFWKKEGMKRARPPSSVILPDGQLESILDDVANYLHPDNRKWHRDHGLQHRRSFLFFGPPGTGKTSTIRAIASKFRLNCCFLSMTSPNFNNQALSDALHQVPSNALMVLEDIDTVFNEDRRNAHGGHLTFSGVLNALDGLISADGVITIMTTNHIDRLDKALIRSGRVDRRFHFDRPTNRQISKLFLSFYPNAAERVVQKFLKAVLDRPEVEEARSIATLQQLFINQRLCSAEECANNVVAFFESHFPSGSVKDSANIYM